MHSHEQRCGLCPTLLLHCLWLLLVVLLLLVRRLLVLL